LLFYGFFNYFPDFYYPYYPTSPGAPTSPENDTPISRPTRTPNDYSDNKPFVIDTVSNIKAAYQSIKTLPAFDNGLIFELGKVSL
jgi:hypothetical protein